MSTPDRLYVASVTVAIEGEVPFEGRKTIQFSWSPTQDDPLLLALLDKNADMLLAGAKVASDAGPFDTGV